MTYTLAIGDRSYSSWSLRGWLMFAKFGLPVELDTAALYTPEFPQMLAAFAPAQQVPALRIASAEGDAVVWDSLAIAETLAERHPNRGLWPEEAAQRALARALCAEMHAGFGALRRACPMNLRRAYAGFAADAEVRADLARVEALWSAAGGAAEGWLFGAYTLADAFYAPVAARIAGYDLPVGAEAGAYVARHLADPAFRAWRAEGLAEPHDQPRYRLDLPEQPWPGPA